MKILLNLLNPVFHIDMDISTKEEDGCTGTDVNLFDTISQISKIL